MWMVGDVSVVREQFREAAWTLGLPLLVLDWTEADDRVATDGCPEGVILTDWDLAVDPDDSYLFVTRCSRVLVCYSGPLDSLSAQWLERPNLEILPLPLDVEDFEQAIAWLAGEAVEADWSGSKTALGVVLP